MKNKKRLCEGQRDLDHEGNWSNWNHFGDFDESKEIDLCWNSLISEKYGWSRSKQFSFRASCRAYNNLYLFIFFNNDPANLRQTFSSTSKSVQFNWAGRGFLIYRFNFLATLVPYCSTVYVYALFFSNNKNNSGIYLLLR